MAISLPRPVSTMSKRFIYEDFTHYEGMIRVPKTDPRLTPHPDTYVDGIFRWPHTPEFSEPVFFVFIDSSFMVFLLNS